MDPTLDSAAAAFAALGHPARLAIFRLLARRAPWAARAGEIAGAVGVAASGATAHLAILARAGLIDRRRQGREVRYSLDLPGAGALVDYLALDCCRGRPELCAPLAAAIFTRPHQKRPREAAMPETRPYNVLFLCTGNSARSIFAEAILTREGREKFRAFSAGIRPQSELNPFAMAQLQKLGYDTSALRSKHYTEFQAPDAPKFDFVFTVCDQAANEECPPWEGQPITGHWGMPDPVKTEGTPAEKAVAFAETFRMLKHRISAFVNLPFERLDAISLQRAVDKLGEAAEARDDATHNDAARSA